MDDATYEAEDARDRRAALAFAQSSLQALIYIGAPERDWHVFADDAYRWLQRRDSLHAVSVEIIPGKPTPEGEVMTATVDLSDTNELPFTLTGLDAKSAQVPAPADTWAWTLNDPDASGAVLTVSADTLSAVVAAGTPTVNLSLSVTGQTTALTGAESIIVQATAATTIGLAPGTPTPEPAPAAG